MLLVCLTLLASFFLPSHLSLKHVYTCTYVVQYAHTMYSIDRTLKMYIGGSQKRPDAQYARPVRGAGGGILGQVAEGNRKDIREAVEAAHKAAPG